MLCKLTDFFKKEYAEIIAFIIVITLSIWIHGCESQVYSLSGNGRKLSRSEIQAELDTYLALAKIRFEQLDKQDEFKQAVFNIGINLAEGGGVNPLGVALILGNIIGIGATVDNVRKRKVIKSNLTEYVAATKKPTGSDTG